MGCGIYQALLLQREHFRRNVRTCAAAVAAWAGEAEERRPAAPLTPRQLWKQLHRARCRWQHAFHFVMGAGRAIGQGGVPVHAIFSLLDINTALCACSQAEPRTDMFAIRAHATHIVHLVIITHHGSTHNTQVVLPQGHENTTLDTVTHGDPYPCLRHPPFDFPFHHGAFMEKSWSKIPARHVDYTPASCRFTFVDEHSATRKHLDYELMPHSLLTYANIRV